MSTNPRYAASYAGVYSDPCSQPSAPSTKSVYVQLDVVSFLSLVLVVLVVCFC